LLVKISSLHCFEKTRERKEKSFASGADRKMIEQGAAELGVTLAERIETVLKAMQGICDKLGL
jgi:predicted hydrolase (HD superfamily)